MLLNVIRKSGDKPCPKEEVYARGHPAPPTDTIRARAFFCDIASPCLVDYGLRWRRASRGSQAERYETARGQGACLRPRTYLGHVRTHAGADT